MKQLILTEKNDNTYGWVIKTPYGKDCRLLAQYVNSLSSLVT